MSEKDALWVRFDGIVYKMMFNARGKRVCEKCEARTKCVAKSKLWDVCGANKASYMRKLRIGDAIFNKNND